MGSRTGPVLPLEAPEEDSLSLTSVRESRYEIGESRSRIVGASNPMCKLTWVSPEEKCVALREKEHVKEICLLTSTPHRSLLKSYHSF